MSVLSNWRRNSVLIVIIKDYLKDTLEALVDCTVKWNLLGKDKKQEWGVASLLAEVRIRDGICFYQFSHTLRIKLYNPRIYTKLNLRLQNQFRSQYALVFVGTLFRLLRYR